jgi:hypothetical protein
MFILRYLVEKMKVTPRIIMTGTKIISMDYKKLHFRDSLNFLPMALSKLPKTLDLDPNLNKGRYPYLFNTETNMNYVGEIPGIEFYDTERMSIAERTEFLTWHQQQRDSNYVFNQRNELLQYCELDVKILRLACTKFRQIIKEIGNVDPLTEAITLAHLASKIFRRNHLKDDEIGLIPVQGYRWVDTQSKIAIKWMLSIERETGINIRHAGNGREHRLASGELVDGFSNENNQEIIYEFLGCLYHACPKCYPACDTPIQNNPHDTMRLRRESTDRKLQGMKDKGYIVKIMRECVFNDKLKNDPILKDYLDNHPMVCEEVLNVRDSLYGGRVESIRIYQEASEDFELDFSDFRSLYPYAMKYCPVPIGHPKILLGPNFPDVRNIHGIIKCVCLPPRHLFLPLLPTKINSKLLFVLCRTCAENSQIRKCKHTEEERALKGTWVLSEIHKALELGYKILKISEIWEYETSTFNRQAGEGGVFESYINLLLKLKQEASSWPHWCVDDESKDLYIQQFFEAEGIRLDATKIALNSGLRAIAKLLLNSLYGRFGMKIDKKQTAIINDPSQFYKLLSNPNITIHNVICIGQESLVVHYDTPIEVLSGNNSVNVAVAAFITTGARLHLYSYLEQMPKNVMYMDTGKNYNNKK